MRVYRSGRTALRSLFAAAGLVGGDEENELGPGCAVTLPAHSPHRWENRGRETVEVLMVASRARG